MGAAFLRWTQVGDEISNVPGTSFHYAPEQSKTWINYWKEHAEQEPNECIVFRCTNPVTCGAHVSINNNQTIYIAPLCQSHNAQREQTFRVNANHPLVKATPMIETHKNVTYKATNVGDSITNARSTSGHKPPEPYRTWIAYWKAHAEEDTIQCVAHRCTTEATHGSHVHLNNGTKVYIAPLCNSCNVSQREPFRVNAYRLLVKAI